MSDENGRVTNQLPSTKTSEYNAQEFLIIELMNKRHHAEPVQVISVDIPDGLGAGRVTVQPLINMLDAEGNAIEHGQIANLTYFRLQGGNNAFVIDPQVGDVGIAIFVDRDMSSVKANGGAQSNPGSARRSSWSDGWYVGGLLNGNPTQYVRMSDDGIEIVSPNLIKLSATDIKFNCQTLEITATSSTTITSPSNTINGDLHVTGAILSDTSVTAPNVTGTTDVTGGGISLKTHRTSLVQPGLGTSGPPI